MLAPVENRESLVGTRPTTRLYCAEGQGESSPLRAAFFADSRPGEKEASVIAVLDSPTPRRAGIYSSGTVLTTAALCLTWTAIANGQTKVDFAHDVRPILAESCFECHGPDSRGRKGSLRLDSRADAFADRGGYHVVVAGDPGRAN